MMKTILIASDLSAASDHALRYALEMSRTMQARLVLLHVYQLAGVLSPDVTWPLTRQDMESMSQAALAQQVQAVRLPGDPEVETVVAEGVPATVIIQEALHRQAAVIVLGRISGRRWQRAILGSTATVLYHTTPIPLIVVPQEAVYKPVSRIVLASDIMPEKDAHTLDILEEIGRQFHTKVFIVRVISDRFEEAFERLGGPAKFGRLQQSLDTQYEYKRGRHIVKELNHFIDTHEVDMVAMVPHRHTWLEKWFFTSTTRSMLLRAAVPILVLPEQDNKSVDGLPG